MNPPTQPSGRQEGVWKSLLAHAFTLVDEVARRGISDPFWTFGGGTVLGRRVKVETAAEIVAKKLWHRSDRATARDLFDLSLVIEREPNALATAAPYLVRHREAFLMQIQQRRAGLGAQFEAIDALDYRPKYDEAVDRATGFLRQLPAV